MKKLFCMRCGKRIVGKRVYVQGSAQGNFGLHSQSFVECPHCGHQFHIEVPFNGKIHRTIM